MRALLLFVAAGAAAQPPAALYGTWEVTRDTTFKVIQEDGTPATVVQLYSSTDISETEWVDLAVSLQPGARALDALEFRRTYRAEGLDLTFEDGERLRLRLSGARLGMKPTVDGQTFPEMMLSRAAPPVVPEALRGDWIATAVDPAGVGLELPVRIEARSIALGAAPPLPVRFADDLLLVMDREADAGAGESQSHRVYTVRTDGAALVLDDRRDPPLRLVRR